MKKNDTFRSIVTGILLFSAMTFSSEVFAKDTIYVNSFISEGNSVDSSEMTEYKGIFLSNLIELGQENWIVQDGSLRKNFLKEAAKAAIVPGYSVSDAGAPLRSQHNFSLNSVALQFSDPGIKKVDYTYNDDRAAAFIKTYKSALQEGDSLYSKKSFGEAIVIYEKLKNSINRNLSSDTRSLMTDYIQDLEQKIINAYRFDIFQKLELIDKDLSAKQFYEYSERKKFVDRYNEVEFTFAKSQFGR